MFLRLSATATVRRPLVSAGIRTQNMIPPIAAGRTMIPSSFGLMNTSPQPQKMHLSGSITYSGGQASEGQGGYYASFNRASGGEKDAPPEDTETQRKSMLAMAADVQKVTAVMQELETLETLLQRETDPTTGRSIEIKASIKKLMTNPEVLSALDRLETEGGPVWGLSSAERDLIIEAREKVNEC